MQPDSDTIGRMFENRFRRSMELAGYYVQPMPKWVGFDFLCGSGGILRAVEAKCVKDGLLRLKAFTQIELVVAEEMYANGQPYYVAFPVFDRFGFAPWAELRKSLLFNRSVILGPAWPSNI